MQKHSRKKPINWRGRYDKLLSLLLQIKHDPKANFADLRFRSDAAEELSNLLEKNKRYEWIKIGEALHLRSAHNKKDATVAFVVKRSKGNYEYTIMARGFREETDVAKTEALAKQAVEKHFELLRPSE